MFEVTATVKPGVDPALVEKRLDEILADFLANGPTEDEVRRAATREVAGRIRGLEQVGGFGGKAVALAEGQVYAGDSNLQRTLDQYARTTPPKFAQRCSMARRPALPFGSSRATAHPMSKPRPRPQDVGRHQDAESRPADPGDRSSVHRLRDRACQLLRRQAAYAPAHSLPVTQLALSFDAGFSADAPNGRGLQNLALSLLDEGADGMTSQQIAEEEERLVP